VPKITDKITKDDNKKLDSDDNMKEWILKAAQNYEVFLFQVSYADPHFINAKH
jgi:hypothetical protein